MEIQFETSARGKRGLHAGLEDSSSEEMFVQERLLERVVGKMIKGFKKEKEELHLFEGVTLSRVMMLMTLDKTTKNLNFNLKSFMVLCPCKLEKQFLFLNTWLNKSCGK